MNKKIQIAVFLMLPILGIYQAVNSQGISDPKIVTYIYQIPGWNMQEEWNSTLNCPLPSISGLGDDQILGIKTTIYPDNRLEAFDLTRQTGFRDGRTDGKPWRNGGYTELFRFDPQVGSAYDALAFLDRGSCVPVNTPDECIGYADKNFFTANYPMMTGRGFAGASNSRGKIKMAISEFPNAPI